MTTRDLSTLKDLLTMKPAMLTYGARCFLILTLIGCRQIIPPATPYSESTVPAPFDYAQSGAWASLPDQPDPADLVPEGASPEDQATALIDVFFIHPTTFRDPDTWIAAPTDQSVNQRTDELPIRHQASVFNHVARVYAPRYRQMTFPGFFTEDKQSMAAAINLAYQDVKTAFQHYLTHYRQGRPFILATHSQGTVHGIRLMREMIDGTELAEDLVAAYLVGWPFPADTFTHIPVCTDPTQTGCVIGWCSWQQGHQPHNFNSFYRDAVVVNPISWRLDTLPTAKEDHLGLVGRKYNRIRPQRVQASIHGGILWVTKPFPILPDRNYHIGDYNLFWADIRRNVEQRVEQYLREHPLAKTKP